MALQSSGPISVGDINDEIGESTDSTLDLQTAAQKFPDMLPVHPIEVLQTENWYQQQKTLQLI